MKKYILPMLYTLISIIILTFILSILYYFNIVSDKVKDVMIYLISIISIFIGSFNYSKNSNKKGIINGLIYYIPWFVIMFITSLFLFRNFKFANFIYYIILIPFSVVAGIIGKNQKKDN